MIGPSPPSGACSAKPLNPHVKWLNSAGRMASEVLFLTLPQVFRIACTSI